MSLLNKGKKKKTTVSDILGEFYHKIIIIINYICIIYRYVLHVFIDPLFFFCSIQNKK